MTKPHITWGFEGDRDRIRTCDRLLRRQMLYPAELRDLYLVYKCVKRISFIDSDFEKIRTN